MDQLVWSCVVTQCVTAGACLQMGVNASSTRDADGARTAPWSALLAVVAAATLVIGAVAVLEPRGSARLPELIDLRALAFTATFCLLVPSLDERLRVRICRPMVLFAVVMLVGRMVLWFSTDLLRPTSGADGWPAYGALGVPFSFVIVGSLTGWVVWRTHRVSPADTMLVGAGVAFSLAIVLVGAVAGGGPVSETVITTWIAPIVLSLSLLGRRQANRDDALRRRGQRQQAALVQLGRRIISDDLPVAVARAQELVRTAVGREVVIEVHRDESTPSGGPLETIRSGPVAASSALPLDRHDLAFVEGVVHLLGAVAARQAADERSEHARLYDDVSGLPNRAFALERIAQAHTEAMDGDDGTIVLQMCHLDGLEELRTVHGFDVADRATARFAASLEEHLEVADGWWHAGGDAFVGISPWTSRTLTAAALGAIRDDLAQARSAASLPARVRAGLGVVVARRDATVRDLLHEVRAVAGQAHHRGGVAVAQRDLATQLRERAVMEQDLAGAVERGEIEVHYQPLVEAGTRRVRGYEALARWRHGDELRPPMQWIPVAESSGLINEIGAHVLRQAVRDHAGSGLYVAVNVSPVQLATDGIVEQVVAAAAECGPANLVVEITENALMTDLSSAGERLAQIRRHGIRIAIDDFGTEHSSLTRLAALPFDVLKVDRGFIGSVVTEQGRAVVAAVIAMSRALGKTTVAEGIETEEQLAAVQGLGCDLVQGFLLGRPEPLAVAGPAVGRSVPTGV